MVHCGVEILSMSKRVMNEVMCLAEDNDINIYWALSGDFPLEDAEFYIKEIVVKFYGVG